MRGRKPKLNNPIMTTIILEKDLFDEAKNVANKRGITLSELIRLALINYITPFQITVEEQTKKKGGLTTIQIMQNQLLKHELHQKILLIKNLDKQLTQTNKQTIQYFNLLSTLKNTIKESLSIIEKIGEYDPNIMNYINNIITKYFIK
ncbi:MAG: hypothetical protein QXY65_06675 [Candidatus Methanomethylicaceae archaeon]